MSEDYRIVSTILRAKSANAFKVDKQHGGTTWLPRSLVHGGDEPKIDRAELNSAIEFRLMDWKAEEVGFS